MENYNTSVEHLQSAWFLPIPLGRHLVGFSTYHSILHCRHNQHRSISDHCRQQHRELNEELETLFQHISILSIGRFGICIRRDHFYLSERLKCVKWSSLMWKIKAHQVGVRKYIACVAPKYNHRLFINNSWVVVSWWWSSAGWECAT